MRFEEQVNQVVVRYPELRVYGPQPPTPRSFRHEVRDGVSLGRRLHGRFWRETATAVLVKPLAAVFRQVANEYAYHKTLRALRELEDHRLEDIGIERHDIRAVARAAAYGEPHPRVKTGAETAPSTVEGTYEVAKAA